MNVDGDIVDSGCKGEEVLSDGVIGKEGVGGEMDEGDGVLNEGDKSSTICITRTDLTGSGVAWERVGW